MRKVNVAVIGAGYWGKKIVSEYMELSKRNCDVTLHSVCDPLEDNHRFLLGNYSIPYVTKYHKDIIAEPDINAVSICTPNETHYEICKQALEAGKHVLVEKPMTLNADEAYKLVDLAHEKNLVLSVGHIFRFNNALQEMRNLIKSGFFGSIFWLKLQWTTLMPPIPNRDIITDLAPHPLDISNFLLDAWPSKITCKAKAFRREKLEEMAYILAEFDNNVSAHFELSWVSPGKIREVSLMGSARFAKVDCLTQDLQVYEDDHFHSLDVERNNTIEAELNHFIRCIQNKQNGVRDFPHKNNGTVGARVVKLLEVARLSNEEEKTRYVEFE